MPLASRAMSAASTVPYSIAGWDHRSCAIPKDHLHCFRNDFLHCLGKLRLSAHPAGPMQAPAQFTLFPNSPSTS